MKEAVLTSVTRPYTRPALMDAHNQRACVNLFCERYRAAGLGPFGAAIRKHLRRRFDYVHVRPTPASVV